MAGRDDRVVIKLNPKIKSELQKKADEYGLTMSALVAFLIGDWLHGSNDKSEK